MADDDDEKLFFGKKKVNPTTKNEILMIVLCQS
jgi:hypothetical protein